jgi:hypothetical protein
MARFTESKNRLFSGDVVAFFMVLLRSVLASVQNYRKSSKRRGAFFPRVRFRGFTIADRSRRDFHTFGLFSKAQMIWTVGGNAGGQPVSKIHTASRPSRLVGKVILLDMK